MKRKAGSNILGLYQWGLTRSDLRRLGNRPLRLTIQQRCPSIRSLLPFSPRQRLAKVALALARGLTRIEAVCPPGALRPRGSGDRPYSVDGCLPANTAMAVAELPNVRWVTITGIHRMRRAPGPPPEPEWFAVRGRVAIQVEGKKSGYQTIEDRILLVKALTHGAAERRLRSEWRGYAEPYLNAEGLLVRWQLEEITDVYRLADQDLASPPAEVYSRFSKRRIRPEYEWHPRRKS